MLKVINPRAAAADVGSEVIYVSIAGGPPERFGTPADCAKRAAKPSAFEVESPMEVAPLSTLRAAHRKRAPGQPPS